MKILNPRSGYRATLEEQTTTTRRLTTWLKTQAEVASAVCGRAPPSITSSKVQAPPLALGDRLQRHAPDVHGQVRALAARGVGIFVQKSDVERRGLAGVPLLEEVRLLESGQLADLLPRYDHLWHW